MRDHYLENYAIRIGQHVLAVDLAPLIAARWTTEMTGLPVVDALTAIPVFVRHAVSFPPVVVAHILAMLFLVVARLVVVMFLCEGDSAGEAERQGGYSQSSEDGSHRGFDSGGSSGRCQDGRRDAVPGAGRRQGRAGLARDRRALRWFALGAGQCGMTTWKITPSGLASTYCPSISRHS